MFQELSPEDDQRVMIELKESRKMQNKSHIFTESTVVETTAAPNNLSQYFHHKYQLHPRCACS